MDKLKLLIVVCVLFAFPGVASAQTLTPVPTPVDYNLPYPGLLPGHPLSFLKEARDVILGFFISQPLDKAEFNLLQADKNIQASYLLSTKSSNKTAGVISTMTTAEDYFARALVQRQEAQSQGIDTRDVTKTLSVANKKHQEIIAQILTSARKEDIQSVKKQLERAQQFEKELKSLLRK